jgi:hypothetical protein
VLRTVLMSEVLWSFRFPKTPRPSHLISYNHPCFGRGPTPFLMNIRIVRPHGNRRRVRLGQRLLAFEAISVRDGMNTLVSAGTFLHCS